MIYMIDDVICMIFSDDNNDEEYVVVVVVVVVVPLLPAMSAFANLGHHADTTIGIPRGLAAELFRVVRSGN